MRNVLLFLCAASLCSGAESDLDKARDRQDRAALEKTVAAYQQAADKAAKDAKAYYQTALASSFLAETSLELSDKAGAQRAAEVGIKAAEKAISLDGRNAEYYRVLASLCGQAIPANVLAGMAYGKRAKDAVAKAIELDPKSSRAHMAQGVGNFYLPPMFGGGPEPAIRDFKQAIELDAKSADAYLWLGLALRKQHRNAEAREAFSKSLELNPNRVWAKQQLDKTP